MKTTIAVTLAASAAAVLLAACGGGGGSNSETVGESTPPPAALKISGTAATGLALANSTVAVKCSTGSGTATTLSDGTYSLSITGGALPCVIQVTGEADGTSITLHSVTETSAGSTSVVANVTPLTEMIVAQLTGTLPSNVFSTLESGGTVTVTKEQLNAATVAVVTALKDATGIDLTAIDPFKSPLVAATATAPTQGNEYDKLLDTLNQSVPTEALPMIVNQIASAAASTTDGSNTTEAEGKITLTEVMQAVDGGSLPGCAQAVSGKYRTIDYFGRTFVRQIDFKNKTFNRGDGQPLFTIDYDSVNKPCEFTVSGTFEGKESRFDVVIGPQGAGTYKSVNVTDSRATMGYIFPVQAHPVSAIVGEWTFLQSGNMPGDGIRHFLGKMTLASNNKVNFCDYNPSASWACEVPTDMIDEEVNAATDGGFRFYEVATPTDKTASMYAYRSPAGTLTLFGTTNPAGTVGVDVEQTHFIAARLAKQTIPAVGTAAKYWEVMLSRLDATNNYAVNSPASISFSANSNTVTAVDAANNSYSRTRASDGRVDTIRPNAPLEGMRFRPPVSGVAAGAYFFPYPGLGLTTIINAAPSTDTFHFYAVSAGRQ